MSKKYKKFCNRGKSATIAEKMETNFRRLPYDDETGTIGGMEGFRRLLSRKGVYVEECPASYDSSRAYSFRDGSRGYLGNPRQKAFTAFFYAM